MRLTTATLDTILMTMKTIPLTQGQVALVDDADYDAVSAHKWHAVKTRQGSFYAVRKIPRPNGKQTSQSLHQFLMPGVGPIDHINGDRLNNQRYNLRPATHQQNMQGFQRKQPHTTSKFRGVYWNKQLGKWHAQIKAGGRRIHLGFFTDETDAGRAYDTAARRYFGDRAHLNFPDSSQL